MMANDCAHHLDHYWFGWQTKRCSGFEWALVTDELPEPMELEGRSVETSYSMARLLQRFHWTAGHRGYSHKSPVLVYAGPSHNTQAGQSSSSGPCYSSSAMSPEIRRTDWLALEYVDDHLLRSVNSVRSSATRRYIPSRILAY